jgi:hypothetical protein
MLESFVLVELQISKTLQGKVSVWDFKTTDYDKLKILIYKFVFKIMFNIQYVLKLFGLI